MNSIVLIAHRGASRDAPENTLSSFDLARKKGALVIECDIAFSKDKIPFIIHDDTLNRTTNGRGRVEDKTWQELQTLDAGSWFSPDYREEKLISLQELLEWQKKHPRMCLNLEIKAMNPSLIEEQMPIILALIHAAEHIIVSSFQAEILQYLKARHSRFPRALLVERWSLTAVFLAKSLACEQLNIGNRMVTTSVIQKTHAAGLKLGVYTVNSKRRFQSLKRRGVDAIFSDDCEIDPS